MDDVFRKGKNERTKQFPFLSIHLNEMVQDGVAPGIWRLARNLATFLHALQVIRRPFSEAPLKLPDAGFVFVVCDIWSQDFNAMIPDHKGKQPVEYDIELVFFLGLHRLHSRTLN